MDTVELQKRIDASPELKNLVTRFADTLNFHDENNIGIDPFLLLTVVSIVVNILLHCRERKVDKLKHNIRNIRMLSRARLRRLRRELNTLWCDSDASGRSNQNPLIAAIYEVGELSTDEELDALLSVVSSARRS